MVAGTSASREASDTQALAQVVSTCTHAPLRILSGAQEATLSFRGALAYWTQQPSACVTLDIGGGSTEIVAARSGATTCYSLHVDSVRLVESFFRHQPPDGTSIDRAVAHMKEALWIVDVPLEGPLIGASITQRLLSTLALDREEPPWPELSARDVSRWRRRLLRMTRAQVRALHPTLMQGREDAFPAAVVILEVVMTGLGFSASRISPWGFRHGLVLDAIGTVVPTGRL